jgi:hypothetical protein
MRPAFDFDARATLENELGPQERLLWAGRPRQGFVLRAADVFLIPFSLLWGGFVVFWEFTAVSNKAPFFFALWGVPFLLAGCYFVFGRFIADARQRAKTSYGLTNERVIIVSGVFRREIAQPANSHGCVSQRARGRQRHDHLRTAAGVGFVHAGVPVARNARRAVVRIDSRRQGSLRHAPHGPAGDLNRPRARREVAFSRQLAPGAVSCDCRQRRQPGSPAGSRA